MRTLPVPPFTVLRFLIVVLALGGWLGWGAAPASAILAINFNGQSPNAGNGHANGVGIVFTVGSQGLQVNSLGAAAWIADWNQATTNSATLNATPLVVKLWRVSDGTALATLTIRSTNFAQLYYPNPNNYAFFYFTGAVSGVILQPGVQYMIALYDTRNTAPAVQYINNLDTATIKPTVATSYLAFNANRYATAAGYIMPTVNDTGTTVHYGGPTFEFTPISGSAPIIVQQPQGGYFNAGSNATLTVVATNTPPVAYTYQWLKNGATNAGATNQTLALTNLALADAADYRVIVISAGGSVTSAVATVSVTRAAGNVTWNSTSSTAWDVGTTSNWLNTATSQPDYFAPNDTVTFSDTAGLQTNVVLGGVAVNPAAITVFSTNKHYSITGAGRITGGGGLAKEGPGTLTLGGNNDFTGAVNLSAGTLKAASSFALGATNGATTIASGATLDVNGQNLGAEPVSVSGAGAGGAGAIVNSGPGQTLALRCVTLTGDTTFGASNRWDLTASPSGYLAGNGYNLAKVGPHEVWLSYVTNNALGDVVLRGGLLGFAYGSLLGNPAGTLTLWPDTTLGFWAVNSAVEKNLVLTNATLRCENGTVTNLGPVALNGSNVLNVSASFVFHGPISGSGALQKNLAGTVTIAGTNTYTGATRVAAGVLALAGQGSIASSATLQVDAGASLVVTGRTDGTLTLGVGQMLSGRGLVRGNVADSASRSQLAPGASGSIGTLTIAGNLSLSGSALHFDITGVTNEGGAFNDLLVVANLAVSGSNAVVISPLALLNGGTYTLIRYTGTLTGDPASLVPVSLSRYSYSITHDALAKTILLNVSGTGGNLLWVGDGAMNRWEIAGAANWLLGGNPAQFLPGDVVTFDDSGSDTPAIDLVGALQPAGVTVSNSARHYTFSGSGYVAGGTALLKDGPGTLTLLTPNTFTGTTTISNGVVEVGDGSTNGWLPGAVANYGSLVFHRSDTVTLTQPISGPGPLVQAGPGTLNLNANYSMPVAVTGGTLALVGDFNRIAPSPRVLIGSGGTLACPTHAQNLNGLLTLNGGTLAGTGDATYGSWLLASNVTVNGGVNGSTISAVNVTLRKTAGVTFDVNSGAGNGIDLDVTGSINHLAANPDTGLIKTGPGVMRFGSVNTFYGGVRVDAGTLLVDGALAVAANTVTVVGGTLGGAGLIAGPVIVQSGGVLAPGASVGILTVSNTLNLSGQATMELNRTNAQSCDLVRGVSTLAFGGTLNIVNAGDALQGGDAFNLFDAANFTGVFTATNLPALGPHLSWDLSNLAVDGSVAVLTNCSPVALDNTLGAVETVPVTVPYSKFVANDSDPDGDVLVIASVSAPGHGTAQLSLDGLTVTYTATGGYSGPDSFTYTVSDGYGGAAVATVHVTVRLRSDIPPNIVSPPAITNGNFTVGFAGIPGYEYTIEFSDSLNLANWLKATNLFAPTNDTGFGVGLFQFSEPAGTNTQRYYRTAWPPY